MKFYGQFNPPVDQFIYERYFRRNSKIGKGFFIECGAFDGVTESSCKFFEEELHWKGINVEPSPPIYAQLTQNRPEAINVNAALSNEGKEGVFRSVVHPVYGEMCTSGSLNHTEEHKKLLDEMGCSYKEYRVPVLEWKELIQRYKVRKCDLFVLDVEGNELNVIESMKKAPPSSLPQILVVEHGHLDKNKVIQEVEELGYKYDISSYVNSYFIKNTVGVKLMDLLRRILSISAQESEFFENAKRIEAFKEGEEVIKDLSNIAEGVNCFLSVAAEKDGEYTIVYSVSGIEGKSCDDQTVYYELIDNAGKSIVYKTVQHDREDYAKVRNTNLYLKSGNRLIIKDNFLTCGDYKIRVYIEQNNTICFAGERTLSIRENYAEIKGE